MKKEEILKDEELALQNAQNTEVVAYTEAPRGFDDDDQEDVIIPRVKIVQDLSPERKDKTATEGDLINSLTKDNLNGQKFIPVFKYMSNIKWNDRSLGGGIACISRDGKIGSCGDGSSKSCAECGQNKFDNKAVGKDAIPLCTAYFNFFGFVEGLHVPIILSFCKTYYNEGKKMYSILKFSMKDMWKTKFTLSSKKVSKNDNEWYVIQANSAGATSAEDVAYAEDLFNMFKGAEIKADLDDNVSEQRSSTIVVDEDIANEIG
jgi:hypothetical protein